MLFYFTATGNCLHVAKQFDSNPISIPQIINNDDLHFEDEVIGIVAPVYAGEVPKLVKEFIKKATFKANYVYMLLTYGMNDSVSGEWSYNFAKENGINVDYIQTIKMVDNYLPSFDMEEQKQLDKQINEQIALVKASIKERKTGIPVPTKQGREGYAMVQKRDPKVNDGSQITVTDACIGCGICTRVCPVGNFYIEDGKATRKKSTCEFCLACAHLCPKKAITLSISDKNPEARFINEHVTLRDIIKANNQN